MSLAYLPEYAEKARLALALAHKEVAHLAYTHRTLFALPIDRRWVQSLAEREDLAEKIDAFVGRFGRLQDHIGEKLIPGFAALLGESPPSPCWIPWLMPKNWAGWTVRKHSSAHGS